MSKRILLVRHGAVESRYRGCYIGTTEAELSERGNMQACALAPRIRKEEPEAVLCSPRIRTRHTAQKICGSLPLEIHEDLREIDFGEWEGLTFAQVAERDPDRIGDWAAFRPDFRFPGGESIGEFTERTRRAIAMLTTRPEKTLLVVSHGGWIGGALCHILGIELSRFLVFEIGYASLSVVTVQDGYWRLSGLNDEHHLRGF